MLLLSEKQDKDVTEGVLVFPRSGGAAGGGAPRFFQVFSRAHGEPRVAAALVWQVTGCLFSPIRNVRLVPRAYAEVMTAFSDNLERHACAAAHGDSADEG